MLLATLTDENLESAVMFLAAQPAVCLVNVVFSMEMKFGGMGRQRRVVHSKKKEAWYRYYTYVQCVLG